MPPQRATSLIAAAPVLLALLICGQTLSNTPVTNSLFSQESLFPQREGLLFFSERERDELILAASLPLCCPPLLASAEPAGSGRQASRASRLKPVPLTVRPRFLRVRTSNLRRSLKHAPGTPIPRFHPHPCPTHRLNLAYLPRGYSARRSEVL